MVQAVLKGEMGAGVGGGWTPPGRGEGKGAGGKGDSSAWGLSTPNFLGKFSVCVCVCDGEEEVAAGEKDTGKGLWGRENAGHRIGGTLRRDCLPQIVL